MKSEKALDYIERLSNLRDKCYTRIVSTKAVEITLNEISDELGLIIESCSDYEEIKERINELINK